MKKRVLALSMAMVMVAGSLVACGEEAVQNVVNGVVDEVNGAIDEVTGEIVDGTETGSTFVDPSEYTRNDSYAVSEGGAVFNVYVWNEEFKSRVEKYYPGYEVIDSTTGTIDGIPCNWVITPSDDNAYQDKLDTDLVVDAADDKTVDMFCIEADYALKYVNSEFTACIADLGVTDADLADQFQYTKDVVTDFYGDLKGVSWQGCPCVLFYNRNIATEVLGTDDPDEVQKAVKDWDTFNATAADVKAAGYNMTATVNDSYRVYSNNVTSPWVVNGKINLDDNLVNWVNDSKEMYDNGYTTTESLWSDAWNAGMMEANPVFCYFGPAWLINFCMHAGDEGSVATAGDWGACVGPQSSFWGGTWICATAYTDNADIVANIIKTICCDKDTMVQIVENEDDFVNNAPAMQEMADSDYASAVLGGQNPLQMYIDGVKTIDLSNLSAYDQGCNEEFQTAMTNYFEGDYTYEEALDSFYKAVVTKYPELTY